MNICSTCQGAQTECQERLDANAEYRAHVNETLAGRGPALREGRHQQELPVAAGRGDRPRRAARAGQAPADRPAASARSTAATSSAPTDRLGIDARAAARHVPGQLIEALGGTVIDYAGSHKCCGFPIITMNKEASLKQAGRHLGDAVDADADCLVTPCPLCHLNLDLQQPLAERVGGPRPRHAGAAPAPARGPGARPRRRRSSGSTATWSSPPRSSTGPSAVVAGVGAGNPGW